MRAAVLVFPGSNADVEMVRTLRDVLDIPTQEVWHRDAELPPDTDFVAIPGGFSYGDYLRAGAIAVASPVMAAVRRYADRGGRVLGVCNGFQILTECGLLPGALTRNQHLRFECRDVFVKPVGKSPLLAGLPPVLKLPIAHAEGRFQALPADVESLERDGRIAFRYCDRDGAVDSRHNPNGSLEAVAGVIGGPEGNVIGLMPHPERASEPIHGNVDGRLLFEAVLRA